MLDFIMWYSFGNKKTAAKNKIKKEKPFKIPKTLSNFIESSRKNSLKQLNKIEAKIIKNINKDLDTFLKKIKKYNDIIDISDIEKSYNKIIHDFRITFSNEILKHIDISDTKCLNILKFKRSKTRRDKMKTYVNTLTDDALKKLCQNIDEITDITLKKIKKDISKSKTNYRKELKNINQELDTEMESRKKNIAKKRRVYNKKKKSIDNLLETIII
ncbi:hypothetical protein [Brachyspira catarrhinii]|uniref:Uncharacterized protein n=1 Tax=Brachyspira catarrhinii TaxID=2528966 RepID=A0ABY2TQ38_9SPIR|nr:hypothetical protein [Brachyspira catarrhinii]TKZ34544.1 hypothetical protein EZH24_07660 [Brachyspira catarrhinii]